MANHVSPRTTQLYDRRRDEVSLDEVERVETRLACQRVTQRFVRGSNSWLSGHLTADRIVMQRLV